MHRTVAWSESSACRKRAVCVCFGLISALTACGADDGQGSSGMPSASGGGGGSGASPAGSGGSAGSVVTAGAGGSGGAELDCSGTFGEQKTVFTAAEAEEIASPALSPDELEMFYSRIRGDGSVSFERTSRASTADSFPAGSAVPELDSSCQAGDLRGIDLSADGLRAYVVCIAPEALPFSGTLRMAERGDPSSPFVLNPMEFGTVGSSPAIGHDELTLYTSNDYNPGTDPGRRYTRTSISEAFGPASDVPGLDDVIFTSPDPGPDGLSIFMGKSGALAISSRAAAADPFGTATDLIAGSAAAVFGSPEVSQDCRAVYFIGIDYTSGAGAFTIQVIER
jgi:hypothetical protein